MGGGVGRELWNPPHRQRTRVDDQALPFHTRHRLYNVDRRWRLQMASSFQRKTRRPSEDVVPNGKQGTRDWREKTVMVTGTKTEGRGTGTRVETRTKRRVE